MENLKTLWKQLISNYTLDQNLIETFWGEIVKEHTATNRHYHNLHHLEYMVQWAIKYKDNIQDLDTLLFSIFYHDIVYNVKRSDNELKSAQIASERLQRLGVPNQQISRCFQQILATKNHNNTNDPDTSFLLDIDLAILGEQPEKYQAYAKNVRKEYALYPDFLYNKGRKKVLQHFLNMDNIFKTQEFLNSHEALAKHNLKTEMEAL